MPTSGPKAATIKAKFDDVQRSKTDVAQVNELLCNVLFHNPGVVIHSMYEVGSPVVGYRCERCGHEWLPRRQSNGENVPEPRICPKCKSAYWNVPRKQKREV